mgnify:CR=1 FL=1
MKGRHRMAVLLNLFFDDYGLPSNNTWVFLAIVFCIINIILFIAIYNDNDFLPIFSIVLFLALFYPFTATNPYRYIPISGTDIQKVNLQRCTSNKTANHKNIKNIMIDCRNRNMVMEKKKIVGAI